MISQGIHILDERDLDAIKHKAFQRGVERGRFEERAAFGKEPVAMNCANWKNGQCNTCGAQTQYCEVDALFKCPHFTKSKVQEGK